MAVTTIMRAGLLLVVLVVLTTRLAIAGEKWE